MVAEDIPAPQIGAEMSSATTTNAENTVARVTQKGDPCHCVFWTTRISCALCAANSSGQRRALKDIFLKTINNMEPKITGYMFDLCFGMMLGDGYIEKKRTGSFSFQLNHGTLQEKYIRWMFEPLKPLATRKCVVRYYEKYNKDTKKWFGAFRFNLPTSTFLGRLHGIFYDWDGTRYVKIVPECIRHRMNEVVFAVLMGDDGGFCRSYYEISSQGFSLECQNRLVRAINEVLGLSGKVVRHTDKYNRIRFPTEDTDKIASILSKYWSEGLHYKLPKNHPLYKTPAPGMGLPLPLSDEMADWRRWYVEQIELGKKTLGYQVWLKANKPLAKK